jgi:hypothetical protein
MRRVLTGLALVGLGLIAGFAAATSIEIAGRRDEPVTPTPDSDSRPSAQLEDVIRARDARIEELEAAAQEERPPRFDPLIAIVYDNGLSIQQKLRQISELAEPEKSEALARLGAEFGSRVDLHNEILKAIAEERDPELLALMGIVLRRGGLRNLKPQEVSGLEELYRTSTLPDQRVAILRSLGLAFHDRSNSNWPAFVAEILTGETNPKVIAALAESCFEVDAVIADASIREAFVGKLPSLHGQPAFASVVHFLQLSREPLDAFSALYELWATERDPQARESLVGVMLDLAQCGFLSRKSRNASQHEANGTAEFEVLGSKYVAMYAGTRSLPERVRMVCEAQGILGVRDSAWIDLLRDFLSEEDDVALRNGLLKLVGLLIEGHSDVSGALRLRQVLGFEHQ